MAEGERSSFESIKESQILGTTGPTGLLGNLREGRRHYDFTSPASVATNRGSP
jgi:hypothetical protein